MLLVFNVIIAILCIIPILIIKFYPSMVRKKHFKKHVMIFIVKLLFISMFIYFFIFNLSIPNYRIFIISGYINFTIFHIIEGFLSQKNLLENEIKN
jgi:hypothetical protein